MSSQSIQFIPACTAHIPTIARRMRAADAAECRAMSGLSPREGLRRSMQRSEAFTVLIDGRPEMMFGTSDLSVLAGVGSIWLLGTTWLDSHPRELLHFSREWVPKLFSRYEVLRNVVSVDNVASIRWLKWLGAQFSEPVNIGGVPFVLFEIRKRGDVR